MTLCLRDPAAHFKNSIYGDAISAQQATATLWDALLQLSPPLSTRQNAPSITLSQRELFSKLLT